MNALPLRDAVIAQLQMLSDEQVAHVLAFIQTIQGRDYDEKTDPLLNEELLFSCRPDLAEQAEDILGLELGTQQKPDDPTE